MRLGRSTGYGALIIRTHSFQEIDFIEKYRGPGCYRGRAVKLGAGAQGMTTLIQANKQNPPQAMLTGECPVCTRVAIKPRYLMLTDM
jgi:hypothetical protein